MFFKHHTSRRKSDEKFKHQLVTKQGVSITLMQARYLIWFNCKTMICLMYDQYFYALHMTQISFDFCTKTVMDVLSKVVSCYYFI